WRVADLGEIQSVANQFETGLLKGETVVAFPFEPRITRLLFACPDPPKECFESKLDSLLYILQDLRVNGGQVWMIGLPGGKHLVAFVQGHRLFVFLPGRLAN